MIPRASLLWLFAGVAGAALLVAVVGLPGTVWVAVLGAVIGFAGLDALFATRLSVPGIERKLPASMSLMNWIDVGLSLSNRGDRALRLRVFDHHPQAFDVEGLPRDVVVRPQHFADVDYRARPTQRGEFEFRGCELRVVSPFGLWWRRRFVDVSSVVRVYPNYSTISKLLAFEVDNKLQLTGVRMSRRRGEGIEFHQLRDYREGDSMRAIDWKATARMSRPITREYQDERDQQIVFLLDTGRRMLAKDAELSHFDHALNAMLLLSYVALRQGDGAGVMTAGPQRSWLPPRKGVGTINAILNHVYDINPQPVEVDYLSAATELAVRQRRRALVVILTNVREEDSESLLAATGLLRRRHLVILASLREGALDDVLEHPVSSFDDALRYAGANQYLEARQESQDLLRARGVFVEDCLCEHLPAAITSRYLAIKRAGML
ncbi:MAG: DUF58 domain-containing protein [Gammaproteobacteria bacterium]|nr:DUF58 domain-containing protein [Gammaproteobacteria bacterium]NNF49255.1 DUF58 domain-containing protein [Woeseiaceae bacterium]MBT8094512.1 DUF58 domain-containing protein [Gammaproteobacteria bacterium]MBT8104068.1 DUF58 domain-containing protein [Gammaproteobacteria bacterium]NNK24083.1 DUF58 domain-containing protein [Woeseiaceae bacterium]